jgi:hypothetical protein
MSPDESSNDRNGSNSTVLMTIRKYKQTQKAPEKKHMHLPDEKHLVTGIARQTVSASIHTAANAAMARMDDQTPFEPLLRTVEAMPDALI